MPVPFSFAHRETRQARKLGEMSRQQQDELDAEDAAAAAASGVGASAEGVTWSEKGETVGQRQSFKARDVPRSMSEPRWEMMRVQEAERRERVAHEALRSAQRSKLPPRMQMHKETARARRAAEAERIQVGNLPRSPANQ